MPKHVPSFKHLISSSSSSSRPEKRERSVNELIAASRSDQLGREARDPPPHVDSSRQTESWPPAASGSTMVGCGTGPIHPAELLRRAEVNRRQAARSVAGPVPPPSWRSRPVVNVKDGSIPSTSRSSTRPAVTRQQLISAQALFTHRSTSAQVHPLGTAKLVEHCLRAVLGYLESDEIISDRVADVDEGKQGNEDATWTIGQAMREQVGYLEPHLKIALLDIASLLPEGDPSRLSDRSVRAILARLTNPAIVEGTADYSEGYREGERLEGDDWSDTSDTLSEIKHLALTLHPSPVNFLRQILSFPALTLTSLNLAYSLIRDLEKLFLQIPAGVRELGLVGVRFPAARLAAEEDSWRRGLGVLARRMIVLKMLDLSVPSSPLSLRALVTLLQPTKGKTPLPSLGLLGLRGVYRLENVPLSPGSAETRDGSMRSDIIAILRHSERKKWVDVIWE